MTYEIPCTACKSEGYFFFQGRLESCHKCKGWGVLEEETEFSVFDGKKFVDVFEDDKQAQLALVDCIDGRIEHNFTQREWNYSWNFGDKLT